MRLFILSLLTLTLFACNNPDMENKISQLEEELAAAKAELEQATTLVVSEPGLIHNVFFWLREGLTAEEEAAFVEGVKSLKEIGTVRAFYVGPPAPTEARDVVDNSFSYALLVHFDDLEGQNAYQVDPIHLKFIEDHKDKWTTVKVYDNVLIK